MEKIYYDFDFNSEKQVKCITIYNMVNDEPNKIGYIETHCDANIFSEIKDYLNDKGLLPKEFEIKHFFLAVNPYDKRYTGEQVEQQRKSFETLIQSTNLKKIGNRILWFMANDAKDGRFTPYCYVLRVLRIYGVCGTMAHPDNLKRSYSTILEYEALNAFINSLPEKKV